MPRGPYSWSCGRSFRGRAAFAPIALHAFACCATELPLEFRIFEALLYAHGRGVPEFYVPVQAGHPGAAWLAHPLVEIRMFPKVFRQPGARPFRLAEAKLGVFPACLGIRARRRERDLVLFGNSPGHAPRQT